MKTTRRHFPWVSFTFLLDPVKKHLSPSIDGVFRGQDARRPRLTETLPTSTQVRARTPGSRAAPNRRGSRPGPRNQQGVHPTTRRGSSILRPGNAQDLAQERRGAGARAGGLGAQVRRRGGRVGSGGRGEATREGGHLWDQRSSPAPGPAAGSRPKPRGHRGGADWPWRGLALTVHGFLLEEGRHGRTAPAARPGSARPARKGQRGERALGGPGARQRRARE